MGREELLKKGNLGGWSIKTAADQSKIVSYTDRTSSEEEEKDLHVDVDFDELIDLSVNFLLK